MVTGELTAVQSRDVVACDGAGSSVRRFLDIPFEGPQLDFSLSVMVRIPHIPIPAPLSGAERYLLIGSEGSWGIFTSVNGKDIWRLTLVGLQERLISGTYDVNADVRRALGSDDIAFEVVRTLPWRRSQCVAKSYRSGRVFFSGDSAHTMSPTGGHGVNTGIGDVSDLGWMLEAMLAGWGGRHLLDAYEAERRPIGIRNGSIATRHYKGWVQDAAYTDVVAAGPRGDTARKAIGDRMVRDLHSEWNSSGIALGFRYERSPIIVCDGTPEPGDDPSNYEPSTRPGHRVPHSELPDGRSIIDLFGRGFVLLRVSAPDIDVHSLEQAASNVGMPLVVEDIAWAKVMPEFQHALFLIRPDGHVAWRGDAIPADPNLLIDIVRGAVAHRETPALAC